MLAYSSRFGLPANDAQARMKNVPDFYGEKKCYDIFQVRLHHQHMMMVVSYRNLMMSSINNTKRRGIGIP